MDYTTYAQFNAVMSAIAAGWVCFYRERMDQWWMIPVLVSCLSYGLYNHALIQYYNNLPRPRYLIISLLLITLATLITITFSFTTTPRDGADIVFILNFSANIANTLMIKQYIKLYKLQQAWQDINTPV